MKEVLVSLETANLLKEKGFNGKSFYHYHYDTDNERFTLQDNSIQLFIGCEGGIVPVCQFNFKNKTFNKEDNYGTADI